MDTGACIRVGDELISISVEFDKAVDQLRGSIAGWTAGAVAGKLDAFGQGLQAVSLSAAGDGQHAGRCV